MSLKAFRPHGNVSHTCAICNRRFTGKENFRVCPKCKRERLGNKRRLSKRGRMA